MSLILGIDTSSTDLGIGLWADKGPLASYSRFPGNSHAETIASAVSMTLSTCGLTAGDVTHIAIACGPGSFTGLRIGIAFVKGFCFNTTVAVLPLSSLFILAHGAMPGNGPGECPVVAAIDARRDEVFWARFLATSSGLVRVTEDCRSGAAEFQTILDPRDTVITDTTGYLRSSVFDFLKGRPQVMAVERHPLQRGLHCAAAGALALAEGSEGEIDGSSWQSALDVLPRYHRDFAAPAPGKST